jgi:plastocyanin
MRSTRRKFLIKTGAAISVFSTGCINTEDNSPRINIDKPLNSSNVDREFEVSINVSNYELRSTEVVGEGEDIGFIVLSINEKLNEGDKVNTENSDIYALTDGETQQQIELSVPGENTINAYLVNKDRTVTSYSDQIEIIGDFKVISEVLIGENGAINVNPNSIVIPQGQTVNFRWRINGVNLRITQKPDGSDWDGVTELKPKGYTHSHKFTTKGVFKFECRPHEGAMQGTIKIV